MKMLHHVLLYCIGLCYVIGATAYCDNSIYLRFMESEQMLGMFTWPTESGMQWYQRLSGWAANENNCHELSN